MKNIRLVLIVAIVALLVVGGAYAAWTSRVTILTNASAGEMDVEISSVTVGKVSEYVVFGADSISVSEDKKSATVTIKNLYPGAEANATIVITNIGTIPVMLSAICMATRSPRNIFIIGTRPWESSPFCIPGI